MILIIGALDAEIDAFHGALDRSRVVRSGPLTYTSGALAGREVAVVRSGVGKVLAAMTTQHMIDVLRPSTVIFTGVAGALNSALEVGDLVVGEVCIQHDMDAQALGFKRGEVPYTNLLEVVSAPMLVREMREFLPSSGSKVVFGRVLSGDQFITQSARDSHAYLIDELRGDAVEMEGASVAAVCHMNAVDFIVLRTISDKADTSAHTDFSEFLPRASHQSLEAVLHLLQRLPTTTAPTA